MKRGRKGQGLVEAALGVRMGLWVTLRGNWEMRGWMDGWSRGEERFKRVTYEQVG